MKRIRVSGRLVDGVAATINRRVSREAKIWHSLRHVNVQPLLGVVDVPDETYLVPPWMKHGDLHHFVTSRLEFLRLSQEKQDALGTRAILYRSFKEHDVIIGIASGPAYLHANNVIHGYSKAPNILLDDTLHPKICDFGLTNVMHTEYAFTSVALKGAGFCRWMSPELLKEDESVVKTTASDVYAFGMTIAEILSAQFPFPHLRSALSVVLAVTSGKRPPFEPLSREGQQFQDLWSLAASCWTPDPRPRPTADDIVYTLGGEYPKNQEANQAVPSVAARVSYDLGEEQRRGSIADTTMPFMSISRHFGPPRGLTRAVILALTPINP
ncbi:hypothetical protein FRB95_007391 [Tulasnella sp. JGI-2019a]|nr:hypothetical protein FRB95_007391 [Tulasnella sp. JGI-2019a]